MTTYALVDKSGTVINRIVLNSLSDYKLNEGERLVEEVIDGYDIGGKFDANGNNFTVPEKAIEVETVPVRVSTQKRLEQLGIDIEELKALLK